MRAASISWGGVLLRIVASLALVFATWNPDGHSYWHWAIVPANTVGISTFGAAKALAGVLLLIAWLVLLQATRRSLGILGAVLAAAAAGAVIWLLIEYHLVSARTTTGAGRAVLIVLGVVLGVGLSWSHIRGRVSGQIDTDDV